MSAAPTQTEALTGRGTLLGTVQYMALEQLERKAVDSRTDIWAFGAMGYEMVTGQRAFAGESQTSLIAAILGHEPRLLSEIQPMAPWRLNQIVTTCLAKDAEYRW